MPDTPPDQIEPPPKHYLAYEIRAMMELPKLLMSAPVLARAPRGDNHAVVVVPGFSTDDATTILLRQFLKRLGYLAVGWGNGFNRGPTNENLAAVERRVSELHGRTGRRVSLIGWSLGGVLAREVARDMPHLVRQVITLGSPFRNPFANNITLLWQLIGTPSPSATRNHPLLKRLPEGLPVPATAIYSKTDGIVAWRSCLEPKGPRAENIEVNAAHIGLAFHPPALWVIADRLAQDEGTWASFTPTGPGATLFRREQFAEAD